MAHFMQGKAFVILVIVVLAISAVYLDASEVFAWPGHGGGHGGGGGWHGGGGGWHGGGGGWHGGGGGWGHSGRYYSHGGRYYYRSGWWWIGGVAASALAVGAILASLPDGYTTVYVGGSPYYYYDGMYYTPCPTGYAVVRAPVGVVVPTIPGGYSPVVINGVTYYSINGVTYMATPNGYQVVPQAPQPQVMPAQPAPVSAQVQQAEVAQPVSAPSTENTFTINIPNAKGGYTSVTLEKKGQGYVGPQGEYYEEFPKVNQLKEMYGK